MTQLHGWPGSKGLGTCGTWRLPLGGRDLESPTSTRSTAVPSGAWRSPPLRFIEEKSSFEYGQVNHALAAAMRTLVKEHLILVTQLEQLQRQGLLSLQKLWFYIQPAVRSMDILASLGTRLRGPGRTRAESLAEGSRHVRTGPGCQSRGPLWLLSYYVEETRRSRLVNCVSS